MPKPTGSQAARGVKTSVKEVPKSVAKPSGAPKARRETQRPERLPANTVGWGIAGAVLGILGLAGAWAAAAQGRLDTVQGAPLANVGALIGEEALWLQVAGACLALGGIGLAILAAAQSSMPRCGSAHRIMTWSGGLLAGLWILAGAFMALAADLATEWSHGPGAKAAFATANIIATAPAALVLATNAGSSGCVWWCSGRRGMAVVAGVAAFVALILALIEVNDVRQAAGSVAIATAAWGGVASITLLQRGS